MGCGNRPFHPANGRSPTPASRFTYESGGPESVQTRPRSFSYGFFSTNSLTAGTGSEANAFDVAHDPEGSSNHTTASAARPASEIALRAFIETDTTRAPGFWARNSSASVGASR